MAWQERTYQLKSSAPLVMHSGQTADPLNKFSKAMKAISGKRLKTDADYEELARLEYTAGLYMGADGPVIPAHVIDAMVTEAAKKQRRGKDAKAAVFCPDHARLEYDGPRTVEELWENEDFRLVANVRIQSSRIVRTRPMFPVWEASVTLRYEDSMINPGDLDQWMDIAGYSIGLCDWRPRYGRFEIVAAE
jgi:hypothetical protein